MEKFNQVLDCASTHPSATIRYHASDMTLITDTDTAYLVLLAARSRTAVHNSLTNNVLDYFKGAPLQNSPFKQNTRPSKPYFPLALNQKQVALLKMHKM